MEQALFWPLAALIVVAALLTITRRNALMSALFLAVSLIGVAMLYVALHAEFLFAVQILVYTGGVMVLFLFVIMLVDSERFEHVRPWVRRWWLPLAFVVATVAMLAVRALQGQTRQAQSAMPGHGSLAAVSRVLLTGYLLPFELLSVLLLVAMIGAIVLSKKEI
jgi:NADH-quinone oxidoreductase subunit J